MKNFLFYSCKKASELIEKEKIAGLSSVEKVRLELHLSMCRDCKAYKHSSDAIDQKFTKIHHVKDGASKAEIEEMKNRLLDRLKDSID